MSIELMTAVRKLSIKPSGRKFVAYALADYADENGSCWPSVEMLAEYTGQSARSVRGHLDALEEDGFLIRRRTRNSFGQLGQYRYKIDHRKYSPVAKFARGEKQQKPAAKSAAHNRHTSTYVEEPSVGARKRATRIPETFPMTESHAKYAAKKGMTESEAKDEFECFHTYWLAAGGTTASKVDWGRAWCTWVLRWAKGNKRRCDRSRSSSSMAATALSMLGGMDHGGQVPEDGQVLLAGEIRDDPW